MAAASFATRILPMQPELASEPFHREGWVWEEKYDGWRLVAYKDGPRVCLVSRFERLGARPHDAVLRPEGAHGYDGVIDPHSLEVIRQPVATLTGHGDVRHDDMGAYLQGGREAIPRADCSRHHGLTPAEHAVTRSRPSASSSTTRT